MRLKKLLLVATVLAALFAAVSFAPALADSTTITFEPPAYHPGSPNGQDGWSSTGSAGMGCAQYDHEIVSNYPTAPASFGTQSLRMSNAVVSGCFGDRTFSKSLANEAGESTATNNRLSGGVRQTHLEAQWSFASPGP